MHPLDGAQAKVARAEEHAETLGVEWQRFMDTDPYGVSRHFDFDQVHLFFQVRHPVPPRLPAIAGDIFHNLRAALDYVAAELVSLHGGSPERSAFPIYRSEADFVRQVRFRPRKAGLSPLNGVPATSDAWAFIERLQPYQRGHASRSDPLYGLNFLSNRDKHRMLSPTFGTPLGVDGRSLLRWNADAILLHAFDVWPGGGFVDGTRLATLQFDTRGALPDVQVQSPIAIDITFQSDPGKGPVGTSLGRIREHVAKIVRDSEVFSSSAHQSGSWRVTRQASRLYTDWSLD